MMNLQALRNRHGQIWLNVELIVARSMIDVKARPMIPTPVARPAFSTKLVSAEVTACPACGTRLRSTKDWMRA